MKTASWSCLFMASLTLIQALNTTFDGCWRRSYQPSDTCSKPVSRDFILPYLKPGKVGTVTRRNLVDNRTHEIITTAVDPPIFEIPDFLSSSECDAIIQSALTNGLKDALLMGPKKDFKGSARVGDVAYIVDPSYIRKRIASLTRLPLDMVQDSESVQVGHYWPGGFYLDHYDSVWDTPIEGQSSLPCCHTIKGPYVMDRCHLCRYATVLVYLNDVTEGGGTGFPDADLGESSSHKRRDIDSPSANCSEKSVAVKPKKGKAVFWYNHFRDDKIGWLGGRNPRSLHGGCDVIKGEKWVANFWINVSPYADRNKPSVYNANRWE